MRLVLLSAYIDEDDVSEIESLGLVDRAISKVTDTNATETLLEEIRAASERSGEQTNWADFATAYQLAETVSSEALEELDRRLKYRRGIS